MKTVLYSAAIAALALSACSKSEKDSEKAAKPAAAEPEKNTPPGEAPEPGATRPAPPKNLPIKDVADKPDEYKELAARVFERLAKKDFDGFAGKVMASRDELKAQGDEIMAKCPQLKPPPEAQKRADEMLAQYDPASEPVKTAFTACAAKYDFAKATYVSAAARKHQSICGKEIADHVEVTIKIGDAEGMIVFDDLMKAANGWKLVDGGVSCEE